MPSSKSSPILLACAALVLGACSGNGQAPISGPAAPAIKVTTTTVKSVDWVDVIEAVGTSKARDSVT